MDPLPSALFRREMGWLGHSHPYDYTKFFTSLQAKSEDHITTSSNVREGILLVDENGFEVNPVYSMVFCSGNHSNIVAVGYESGFVTLIDTELDVKEKIRSVNMCHQSAVFSLTWSWLRPQQLVTGSGDQSVRVWDCSRNFELLKEYSGHTRTVKKVIFHPSQPDILVSASRDGAIKIWDLRSPNVVAENYITFAHAQPQPPNKRLKNGLETEVPVTDLIFKEDNTLISCGSHDGYIKFWDLRKTYKGLKNKTPVRKIGFPSISTCKGFSSLCLDQTNRLYAASASKEIFKFDLNSDADTPESVFENNETMLYDIKMSLSSCGRYLASGSRSTYAPIWDTWNMTSPKPFTYLETEANNVLFSPNDPLCAVTGGDDGKVLIWRSYVDKMHKRKNTLLDKYLPDTSSNIKATYLKQQVNYPLYPKYHRVEPRIAAETKISLSPSITSNNNNNNNQVFDLSKLLSDLPNAVMDGNFSGIRSASKPSFSVTKLRRYPSIRTLFRSISASTSTTQATPIKRPADSAMTKITPKSKRRKSIASNSPKQQPKIISFLQPLSPIG